MSHRLRYTEAAEEDLRSIARYIARSSGSRNVARKFTARLRERCRGLASLPGILGTARSELGFDLRSTPCRGYVIFFRYMDGVIEIVNVLEGHRDVFHHFNDE